MEPFELVEEMVFPSILMLSTSRLVAPVTAPPVVERVPSVKVPPVITPVVVTSWAPKSGLILVPAMAAVGSTSSLRMVSFSMSAVDTSSSRILSVVTASFPNSLFRTPSDLIRTWSTFVSSVTLSTFTSKNPPFSTSPSPARASRSATMVSPSNLTPLPKLTCNDPSD